MYVIMSGRLYVNKPGQKCSYTNNLRNAMKYENEYEAKDNCCFNESVVKVETNYETGGLYLK